MLSLVHGQPSFVLRTSSVHASITRLGAMLGPVIFRADSRAPIQPYAIAPWSEENLEPTAPRLLAALRGDFLCSAFGDNDGPWAGCSIPPHGDSANSDWSLLDHRRDENGSVLQLSMDLTTRPGRCVASTSLLAGHDFVYQCHGFSGISGPINPGHHAMLTSLSSVGPASISFSPHAFVCSSPLRPSLAASHVRSRLAPGAFSSDLTRMSCVDGSTIDMTVFPAEQGVEDVLIVCADPQVDLAWSAATFRKAGYAWLSLRRREHLPSTLVWMSNGGLAEPPWNSRHLGVLGLEDMMGYFAFGLAQSARENILTARGIPTCLHLGANDTLRIPYIQGIVTIPPTFDRVATVRPIGPGELLVSSSNGCEVRVCCRWEFLYDPCIEATRTGELFYIQ